jgi:hypothetical protein
MRTEDGGIFVGPDEGASSSDQTRAKPSRIPSAGVPYLQPPSALRIFTFDNYIRPLGLAHPGQRIPAHLRQAVTDIEHPGVADEVWG